MARTADRQPRPSAPKRRAGIAAPRPAEASSPADGILRLQRTVGNAAVQRLLAQRSASGAPGSVSPEVEEGISTARGGGAALDSSVRGEMETAFGADFGGVRVHTGGKADTLNRALGARAFTTGADVFFRSGEFSPSSPGGRKLLAHELAHVVQQGGSSAPVQRSSLALGPPDDAYEREAEAAADAVAAGKDGSVASSATAGAVQRDVAAYKADHAEDYTDSDGPSTTTVTIKGDAPALDAALAALVAAGKVARRDDGTRIFFSGSGATRAEVEAALTAASIPSPGALADALLAKHNTYLYSRERAVDLTTWFLFWSSTHRVSTRTNILDRQSSRPLTAHERAEARRVFAGGLSYDVIRVIEDPVMSVGGFARTLPNHIYFPTGSFSGSNFMPWLIHELTHAWQYQHGYGVSTTLYHALFSSYDYGGEAALTAATAAGRGFRSFNTEQQGDILQDYYTRLVGGLGTTAWDPFVAEVKVP
jgi:hypothetical protein